MRLDMHPIYEARQGNRITSYFNVSSGEEIGPNTLPVRLWPMEAAQKRALESPLQCNEGIVSRPESMSLDEFGHCDKPYPELTLF